MTWTEDNTRGAAPGIEINYGAAPNLQLHLVAPLAIDRPASGPTVAGLGDVEVGVKYRFILEDDHGWRPQVAVFPLVELPAGNAGRGLGAGYTRVFLPVWLEKSSRDWLTYGGGGYWINPGPGNRNYGFAGWLVQRQVTKKLALGVEAYYQGAATVGGAPSPGFNVGGVYDFNEHNHLLFSAGRGLANANATNQFSYYLGYQWTF
jgi:hypothetical protein